MARAEDSFVTCVLASSAFTAPGCAHDESICDTDGHTYRFLPAGQMILRAVLLVRLPLLALVISSSQLPQASSTQSQSATCQPSQLAFSLDDGNGRFNGISHSGYLLVQCCAICDQKRARSRYCRSRASPPPMGGYWNSSPKQQPPHMSDRHHRGCWVPVLARRATGAGYPATSTTTAMANHPPSSAWPAADKR